MLHSLHETITRHFAFHASRNLADDFRFRIHWRKRNHLPRSRRLVRGGFSRAAPRVENDLLQNDFVHFDLRDSRRSYCDFYAVSAVDSVFARVRARSDCAFLLTNEFCPDDFGDFAPRSDSDEKFGLHHSGIFAHAFDCRFRHDFRKDESARKKSK